MDETMTLNLRLRVPGRFAPAFVAGLTGNDDDVLLAAEKAIRAKVGESAVTENVELDGLDREEQAALELMADREKSEQRTYGPYVDQGAATGERQEVAADV